MTVIKSFSGVIPTVASVAVCYFHTCVLLSNVHKKTGKY